MATTQRGKCIHFQQSQIDPPCIFSLISGLPEKDWPCGEDSAGMSVKMAMDRWTCEWGTLPLHLFFQHRVVTAEEGSRHTFWQMETHSCANIPDDYVKAKCKVNIDALYNSSTIVKVVSRFDFVAEW